MLGSKQQEVEHDVLENPSPADCPVAKAVGDSAAVLSSTEHAEPAVASIPKTASNTTPNATETAHDNTPVAHAFNKIPRACVNRSFGLPIGDWCACWQHKQQRSHFRHVLIAQPKAEWRTLPGPGSVQVCVSA